MVARGRWLRLLWLGLAAAALVAPFGLLGLDLARGLGGIVVAAALSLFALRHLPLALRAAIVLGPLAAGLTLLLHPLEGLISPPTVTMALFAWAAAAKAALAWGKGPAAGDLALPFVVSIALLTALLAGWACGRFWLLATFVAVELAVDARLVGSAVTPAATRRG